MTPQPQRLQDEWTRVDRVLCAGEDEDLFAQRVADGKRLGVGLFLTEFGGVGERNGSFDSLRFIAGLADKHMQSWTYWQVGAAAAVGLTPPVQVF